MGIRVSNRKVLQAVLERFGVTPEKFAPVCVVVDKIEKLPRDAVEKELLELGVDAAVIDGLLQAMAIRSLADLTALLGAESVAVKELTALFELAKGPLLRKSAHRRLVPFVASCSPLEKTSREATHGVKRGLALMLSCRYGSSVRLQRTDTRTGWRSTRPLSADWRTTLGPCSKRSTAAPRSGTKDARTLATVAGAQQQHLHTPRSVSVSTYAVQLLSPLRPRSCCCLRAICGGGRYDRLLSAYGGEDQPMCGFGFGDAVIVELLQDKVR